MSTAVPINRPRPLPAELGKKLPSNLDAERAVLGAILLDNSSFSGADKAGLDASHFFLEQNRRLYTCMALLAEDGSPIDLCILTEKLYAMGQLESCGGAAYIASLADGMPKISNVEHYAKIVIDKAQRRQIIHAAYAVQERAFEESDATAQDLLAGAAAALNLPIASRQDDNPAVVVGFQSLLSRECAPIEYAICPLLSKRGTGEIYGWRGVGKSLISSDMAVKIAVGDPMLWGGHRGGGGHWAVSRPFRQLYVYGEMDESEIQERMRTIAKMRGVEVPTDEQLGTICMDYQKNWRPKISTARDRKYIEQRVFDGGYEGLWLDNLSTLWPVAGEAESERDAILAEWYTDLNQRGIWVIWLHHAGKGGEQRGGSQKEDMLSFVLKLHRPRKEEMRVIASIEKNRHKCDDPQVLMPFEVELVRNGQGELEWVTRPASTAQRAAAFAMFKNKMPTMMVGQEVGVSRATAYRWYKDFTENPNPDFHTDSED